MFKNLFSTAAAADRTVTVADAQEVAAETDAAPHEEVTKSESSLPDNDVLRIPFRELEICSLKAQTLDVKHPYRGIGLAWPVTASDPFLSALLGSQVAQGWSTLVWGEAAASLSVTLQDLPAATALHTVTFSDVKRSARVNPVQSRYIRTVDDALQMASSLLSAVDGVYRPGSDFQRCRLEMENLLAACIYFLTRHDLQPYSASGERLTVVLGIPGSGNQVPRYCNAVGEERSVHAWRESCSSLPHVFELMFQPLADLLDVLGTCPDTANLVHAAKVRLQYKDYHLFRGFWGMLCRVLARLLTPEVAWVLSGDEVPLNLFEGDTPSFLSLPVSADGEGTDAVMSVFLLDAFLRNSFRRPASAPPLGAFLTSCPTCLADRVSGWLRRGESGRVSLAVGLEGRCQLSPSVGDEPMRRLFGRFGARVVSSATETCTDQNLLGGYPWEELAALSDRHATDSLCCVAGVSDCGFSSCDRFLGLLPKPPEARADTASAADVPTAAAMRENLLRIQDDIQNMVDRILGRADGEEDGSLWNPAVNDGCKGLDLAEFFTDGVAMDDAGQTPVAEETVQAGVAEGGAQPSPLMLIGEEGYQELFRKASDDQGLHRDMQV